MHSDRSNELMSHRTPYPPRLKAAGELFQQYGQLIEQSEQFNYNDFCHRKFKKNSSFNLVDLLIATVSIFTYKLLNNDNLLF